MTPRLGEEEIAREARRVLRRLASPRAALFQRGQDFAVARGAASAAGSRLTVTAPFAAAFLRAGWIIADGPGRFVLTGEGQAFLVRSFGGADRFAEQHREMTAGEIDGRAVRV